MPRSPLDWGTRTAPAECADRGQTKFSVPGSELFCPRHWRRVTRLERHVMGLFLRLACNFVYPSVSVSCMFEVQMLCLQNRGVEVAHQTPCQWNELPTCSFPLQQFHCILVKDELGHIFSCFILPFSFMIISIVILFYVSQYAEEKQIMLCALVGPWTRTPLSGTHHICIFYRSSSSKSISTEKWSWVYVTWQT